MANESLIFDLDGTLVFLGVDWTMVRQRLLKYYNSCGITFAPDDVRNIFKSIDMAEERVGEDLKPKLRKKAFDIIRDEEIKGAPSSRFRQGANELLESLKGKSLGLVSSNSRAAADIAFKTLGIEHSIFSAIVMRDDVTKLKPDPEGIIKAVFRMRQKCPEMKRFHYVGDQKNDVIAAKEAAKELSKDNIAIGTIALKGGASREEKIKAQRPDHFVNGVKEAGKIIMDLLNGKKV